MGDAHDGRTGEPRLAVRTIAVTRRDRRIRAGTLAGFERALSQVEWFAHLGEPSPWDDGCARIYAWEQWPGPENALGEAFAGASSEIHDVIFGTRPAADSELRALFDHVQASVLSSAAAAVPFDSEQDAWHAPTACAWAAAYTAALIACVLARPAGAGGPGGAVELVCGRPLAVRFRERAWGPARRPGRQGPRFPSAAACLLTVRRTRVDGLLAARQAEPVRERGDLRELLP
jgi:hypothetical protein